MRKKYIKYGITLLRLLKSFFTKPILVSSEKAVDVKIGRRALICYITKPFKTSKLDHVHSNLKEVRLITQILIKLEWQVWVIDFNSEFPIDYSQYDLLLGFGRAFDRSFYSADFIGKRVLLLTGANPCYSNQAEASRILALKERKGVCLSPRRTVYEPWIASAVLADAIFCLGNSWSLSTFQGMNKNIHCIPVPYVATWPRSQLYKNYEKAKNSFLWFGSAGAVHKGLDLVLEAMDILGHGYTLHVCGPVEKEEDFFRLYRQYLTAETNINFHGFVDVGTERMKKIFEDCAYVLFPSCSEGGGSSVITCMHAGLIPIVTAEASVDINDFGLLITDVTPRGVAAAMQEAASWGHAEVVKKSEKSAWVANIRHSNESYEQEFRSKLLRVFE